MKNFLRTTSRPTFATFIAVWLFAGVFTYGQNPNAPTLANAAPPPSLDSDVSADKLEYINKKIIGVGNVVIRRGAETLTADYVNYDTLTDVASARGNVHFDDAASGQSWDGDELVYDFRRKEGNFGTSTISSPPFTVESESSKQMGPGLQELERVMVTTCIPEDPEFKIHARSALVYDEQIVRGKSVVFYLNSVPFLYLPRYTVDLDRDTTRFDVLPGYSSRNGAFLLTAYGIPLTENFTAVTHVDFRAERGIGLGQDLKWNNEEENWRGSIRGYFIDDDAPYKSIEQEMRQRADGLDIDPERYRIRLSHTQSIGEEDFLYAEMGKISDPEVIVDFFDEEHRTSPQPENRIDYIHSASDFSAGLSIHKNLNEEYFSGVNRLPELYASVPRFRIAESPFFYEGYHSAGQLEATFSDFDKNTRGRVDYDTQRVHSSNTILFPTRHFGWLNVIPRIGYTGTFYGDTFEGIQETNVTQAVSAQGFAINRTNRVTRISSLGADTRSLVEFGVESSYKAFKVMHEDPIGQGIGLRHVVEPFVNYTLIPEPELRPANIFPFDAIDTLDRRNDVRVGVRNKLQTKRPVVRPSLEDPTVLEDYNLILDLIDVSVSTTYRLDPEEELGEDELGFIVVDAEVRPTHWLLLDTRAEYNSDLSEFDRVNTQVRVTAPDRSYVALDHFFRPDQNNVLQLEYSLWPENTISFEGYTRYEVLNGEAEEQVALITYKTDCVGYGIGGRWLAGEVIESDVITEDEDEWQAWFQIWLTAFPNGLLELGR